MFRSLRNLNLIVRAMSTNNKPVENSIRQKITNALEPKYLEIINESHYHNVPKGSEYHFKVIVVAEKFNEMTLIKRHRLVNDLLKEELQSGVHALSILAETPTQWEKRNKPSDPSPPCRGGYGK